MLRKNRARSGLTCFFLLAFGCSLSTKGTFHPAEDGRQDPDAVDIDMDVRPDDGGDGEIEIPPGCGDGEVGAGEACDDGNDVPGDGCEPDCTFTCEENADCADDEMCNGAETCTSLHTCDPGTDLPDGNVCLADPRSICLGGACVESACGDGFLDPGNGEICEPSLDGTCRDDCTYACDGDDDCPDDGDECNGTAFCDLGLMACAMRNPLPDGTPCGTDPGVRRICIAGTCNVSACGDGYVDAGATPPEACDDRNLVGGDGCEADCTFTCIVDEDCNDGNVCNGAETCSLSTHTCLPGANAGPGTPCDDGIFCNGADTCDGSGACTHGGNPCVDGLACTDDTCDGATCPHDVIDGWCLDGTACVADGNPCTGGYCCAGACIPGAQCCTNDDCPMGCRGGASPCTAFGDQPSCEAQDGCSWTTSSAGCTGTMNCDAIDNVPSGTCFSPCGCNISYCFGANCYCDGWSSRTCSQFTSSSDCTTCACSWGSGSVECTGVPAACDGLPQAECGAQAGCTWEQLACEPFSRVCM